MSTISPSLLKFLKTLKLNNNRDWFTKNKEYYLKEENLIINFFSKLNQNISTIDNIESMKVYRIYRDIRFSKDKTPYKTYRSCSFKRATEELRGGYHIEITPGNSFIAIGFWKPNKKDLLRIRREFELDSSIIKSIFNDEKFKKIFGGFLKNKSLRIAPNGFERNHKNIELIKKKDFIIVAKLTDKQVLSKEFLTKTNEIFRAARPFLDYMSDILTTNLNGESTLVN